MRELVWDDLFSIGIDEVDADHQILLNLFNLLAQSAEGELGREFMAAVLDELINATAWHFSHEERLMLQHGYEGLDGHKAEHRELIDSVREFQQSWMDSGTLDEEGFDFLERWLTEHILVSDMEFGNWAADN